MPRRPMVAKVGTGREAEPAISNARNLGRLVSENGWALITGGRNAGVMRAANEGAKMAKESLTIGILPDANAEVSSAVDVRVVTDMGEARNNIIVLSADVVIACGVDDPGTASEVALALKAGRPVILLGADAAAVEFFRGLGSDKVDAAQLPEQAIRLVKDKKLLANG